jgi:hypothetical protein
MHADRSGPTAGCCCPATGFELRFAGLKPYGQGRRVFTTTRLDSGLAAGAPVIAAGVDGLGTQFVFNAQELVVLSNPVTAA